MIKQTIYIAVIILSANTAFAQGFDWQLSSRLPVRHSNLFLGLQADYSFSSETGRFDFYEDECNCGSFKDGSGKGFSVGIQGEYWLEDGLTSLKSSLTYSSISPEFSAIQSLPVLLPDDSEANIDYKNTFSSNISYIAFSFGAKRRLFETHFHIGADLSFAVLTGNSETHKEKIIGPSWAPPFSTNPASYERLVSEGKVEELKSFDIYSTVSVGYDIDAGIGYYISPKIGFRIPMMSLISKGDWKRSSVIFGLSFSRWF